MQPLRVAFMGTPDFAVGSLQKLASEFDVIAVFTQPDRPVGRGRAIKKSPVREAAESLGIRVETPRTLRTPEVGQMMAELNPDIVVVVAYGKLIPKDLLDCPPLGYVNVHSSLLPRWRGAAPIQHSILAGDQKSGVTTMRLVEELDAGDILLQKEVILHPDETGGSLHDRLAELGAELIVQTLQQIRAGTIRPRPQDSSGVTYASKLTKEMEWLDPQRTALELERQVRALDPWPGTSLLLKGLGRVRVREAGILPRETLPPGQVIERGRTLLLGTREGVLVLKRLQLEGKKPMTVQELLNGVRGRWQFPLFVERNSSIETTE